MVGFLVEATSTNAIRIRERCKMGSATSFGQLLTVAVLFVLLTGCSPGQQADGFPVGIEISQRVGAQPLRLDGSKYRTAAGEEFSVDHLRYYLSNFRLRKTDGSWFANPKNVQTSQGYFLVDASIKESQNFLIGPVPPGEYSGIEFLVGVDPERNNAGAQRGDLDPARGMFWTWNTGYIFFKLEGHSAQSPGKQHEITYHLGGSGSVSGARLLYLPLRPEPIRVGADNIAQVHLSADIAQVFDGAQRIRIADLYEAMSPRAGTPIADNVAGAFSVEHVHNTPVTRDAAAR
jgi:hypothetical protein